MVGGKPSPRLETANTFRHGLFNCFFEDDAAIRADAVNSLKFVVTYWTQAWLEYQAKPPPSSCSSHAAHRPPRPLLARNSSNGSGVSHQATPPPSGSILRRDSSFKMHFDDVFGLDGDDAPAPGPLRKDSFDARAPLTPENDDYWGALGGECAISPSEASAPFLDSSCGSFSNRGIASFDSGLHELAPTKKQLAEEIWGVDEMRVNLENFYTWLLRFSIDCPFRDVRKGCKDILRKAERMGAQIPQVPAQGPSLFVPYGETIGLSNEPATPATPTAKSPSPYDMASEEEDDLAADAGVFSDGPAPGAGITIPDGDAASAHGDGARARSRARAAAGSSAGRQSGSRRATVSLVSALFQQPAASPTGGSAASQKLKRRAGATPRRLAKLLPKARAPSDLVRRIQMHAFLRSGRVGNVNRILCAFPRFALVCRDATDVFLGEDAMHGPLPQTWRIYLGLLAAAENRCQYYLSLLAEKFLTVQGDKAWLRGLDCAPRKLQRIGRLNLLLAHMPWQISAAHIQELVRGDDASDDLELRWTMAEVVQAILVLSFYHAKARMAMGWGIVPEPDCLGGTTKAFIEKGTPVAPFGSFAQSTSASTAPLSEMARSMRDGDPVLHAKVQERSFTSLLSRKRESGIPEEQDSDKLPEKWRKTPQGSVLASPNPGSSATPMPVPGLRKDPGGYPAGGGGAGRAGHGRHKNPKRRKSFDECATSDDAPQVFAGLSSGFSLSAPNSYVPLSSLSGGGRPLAAFHHQARDYLLSPSSSTSSIFEAGSLVGEQPANVMVEDHARFLTAESLDRKPEDSDPTQDDWEFLAMEEFEWGIASSIITDYLDGLVELLDGYFKAALDADAEDEELFTARSFGSLPAATQAQARAPPLSPTHPDEPELPAFSTVVFDEEPAEQPAARGAANGGDPEPMSRSTSVPPRDNKSVKEAAWYYSLRLLNIQKDDFRYSDIKYLLDKGARRYLKRVCTQPEMVSHADWMAVTGMRNDEKCLLSLLACQAGFLGEVLWGLKACSDYIG